MVDTLSRVRVLHVDDDPAFVETAADALEQVNEQFAVETATDASDALDSLADHSVDCIISDYEMPGSDGLDLLATVREDHPELPFVLFTGKGGEEIASEAISAGVTDYLQKSGGLEQYELLANRIETAVGQYRTERRLRELAANAADVLWMYSNDWEDLLFLDADSERLWGQSLSTRREDPTAFLDAVHPDDRERVQAAMDRLSAGEPETVEFRVNEQEGYERWVLAEGQPIYEDGEVARVAGFTRDITERKKRERELERYERIFEGLNDAIYVIDDDEHLVYVNDRYTELKRADREELLGTDIAAWTSRESMAEVREARQQVASSDRETATVETTLHTADGETIPVENRVINVRRPDGELERIGVVRDITDRMEREQELRRQNERLEEFVSVVSHDLRNPLDVAMARAELLEADCESDHLDHLRTAQDRMATLIEDLLTLARQGDEATDTGPVRLDTAVEKCWRTVETDDAALNVETDLAVVADESRVRQLLANLVRNAVEHGTPGDREQGHADDPAVTITVGETAEGFYVADDGPGIPPDERERIFDSGYTTGDEGTGFGLPIVAATARAHGWDVAVSESADEGARFDITGVETTQS